MKRREALALAATLSVPLAGCSSGDGDDGEENETDGGTEPTQNTTDVDGNSSDVSEGSDGNESDSDGQTDEQSDGQDDDEPEGPTEEELAQEDADAAQSALSDAVSELENQGAGSLGSTDDGPPVTAAVSGLSDGPVRDQLSSVQSTIDDAREHETTGDQAGTLDELETAKDWLHTVLDAYQPLHELYLEANYAVQDYVADAEPDLQAVRRAADQAQSSVDSATNPYETPDSSGAVDAIADGGVQAQVDRLAADLESGRSVADALEEIQAADDAFWPARETYNESTRESGPDAIDGRPFESARDDYDSAASGANGLSGSYSAAASYCNCYCSGMRLAAEEYLWALAEWRGGQNGDAAGRQDAGEAALEGMDCSLDWSA